MRYDLQVIFVQKNCMYLSQFKEYVRQTCEIASVHTRILSGRGGGITIPITGCGGP
jgi:hypothetical protein